MVVPVLILYGGIFQSLVGMVEMVSRLVCHPLAGTNRAHYCLLLLSQFTGNTFGAVVFSSYGAFNLTYGAMYLPVSSSPYPPCLPSFTLHWRWLKLILRIVLTITALKAFGVISAYTLADGTLSPEFNQAIGIYDVSRAFD